MTYYEILGLSSAADETEIKKAFRKLAMKYHPDVSKEPDAETYFKLIYIAYEVLNDPYKRSLYDEMQAIKAAQYAAMGIDEDESSSRQEWYSSASNNAAHYSSMRYEEFEDTLLSKIAFHSAQGISLLFSFTLLCISMILLGLGYYFATLRYFNGKFLMTGLAFLTGTILCIVACRAILAVFATWQRGRVESA